MPSTGVPDQGHHSVLRTPSDLNLFAQYTRPEIVRHFGVHYDPAKHNKGILWFEDQGAVITKLDVHDPETAAALGRSAETFVRRALAPHKEAC